MTYDMTHDSWQDRARESTMNGFTFDALVHEIVGRASTLMAGDRVFDEREATRVVQDAELAIAEFLRVAINQQGLDARAGMPDLEIVALIRSAPAWGRNAE